MIQVISYCQLGHRYVVPDPNPYAVSGAPPAKGNQNGGLGVLLAALGGCGFGRVFWGNTKYIYSSYFWKHEKLRGCLQTCWWDVGDIFDFQFLEFFFGSCSNIIRAQLSSLHQRWISSFEAGRIVLPPLLPVAIQCSKQKNSGRIKKQQSLDRFQAMTSQVILLLYWGLWRFLAEVSNLISFPRS